MRVINALTNEILILLPDPPPVEFNGRQNFCRRKKSVKQLFISLNGWTSTAQLALMEKL